MMSPHRKYPAALLLALIVLLGVLLSAAPAAAQDEFVTNTPDLVLLPREAVGTFTDLTPLRDALLNATDAAPDTTHIVYYTPAPDDPDGLTDDQLFKIGLLILVAVALWFLQRNNVTAAQLIPIPVVLEMVKSAAQAGVEAGRAVAAATPNKIDDALVDFVDKRVAAFFLGAGTPPPAAPLPPAPPGEPLDPHG